MSSAESGENRQNCNCEEGKNSRDKELCSTCWVHLSPQQQVNV